MATKNVKGVKRADGNTYLYVDQAARTKIGTATLTTTAQDLSGAVNELKSDIPTALSGLTDDATHRLVTDTEKSTWNGKATTTDITNAINALDVSSVGGSGKYISAISETDGKISATARGFDLTPTANSNDPVTSGGVKSALDGKLNTSLKGAASGLAELDANGLVPTSQLPSYVDDVLEYANKASFPTTGVTGKIYIDLATNLTYRWSGSAYVEISPSLALGETSSTAYAGNKGKANADAIATLNGTGAGSVSKAISDAIGALDVSSVGGSGKYISAISEADGKISATATNFPTIPAAANNGTLTIQKNGTNVQTFTANQSTNATANITVPTALSDLTADATHRTVSDTEKTTWNGKANVPTSTANGGSIPLWDTTNNELNYYSDGVKLFSVAIESGNPKLRSQSSSSTYSNFSASGYENFDSYKSIAVTAANGIVGSGNGGYNFNLTREKLSYLNNITSDVQAQLDRFNNNILPNILNTYTNNGVRTIYQSILAYINGLSSSSKPRGFVQFMITYNANTMPSDLPSHAEWNYSWGEIYFRSSTSYEDATIILHPFASEGSMLIKQVLNRSEKTWQTVLTDKNSILSADSPDAVGVGKTFQIPSAMLDRKIITISVNRAAWTGSVMVTTIQIKQGDCAGGVKIITGDKNNPTVDKYIVFDISTTGLITVDYINNWSAPFIFVNAL